MSTQCRLVERDAYPKLPGDMWFDPDYNADELSDAYREQWVGKRPPIVIMLPDKTRFCLDARNSTSKENGGHTGWEITGEPPNISASPSIHVMVGPMPDGRLEDSWHGWLKNGVLE